MDTAPIAGVTDTESPYSLEVVYRKKDGSQVFLKQAFIQFLRFANFGRSSIRGQEIAESDSMCIVVENGDVLDISIVNATRKVCGIKLGNIVKKGAVTKIPISFDFLDQNDGALIQTLCDSEKIKTKLVGTIIGMPKGVRNLEIVNTDRKLLSRAGCALIGGAQLVAFSVSGTMIWNLLGGWNGLRELIFPTGILFAPLISLLIFGVLFEPVSKSPFVSSLGPPAWYEFGSGPFYASREMDNYRRERDKRILRKISGPSQTKEKG